MKSYLSKKLIQQQFIKDQNKKERNIEMNDQTTTHNYFSNSHCLFQNLKLTHSEEKRKIN